MGKEVYLVLALISSIACISIQINDGASSFMAGVAKVNATLPLGVPLAGYNHGPRRVPYWPIPDPKQYTTWMTGNIGTLNTLFVKAVVIDNGSERFCFVTMDAIGADGSLVEAAFLQAAARGFNVSRQNIVFSGSHSHSGPGAVSPEFLWAVAPATDLLVPEIQEMYCTFMADAMIQAELNLAPAQMDIGSGILTGVTQNRRAPNPWVQKGTIDPHLGVIRIDDIKGNPLATIWNYAMHGTCYGPENMKFSSEIMGAACEQIEEIIGGVALFINADAGDIDPTDATCGCSNGACEFTGAVKIADAVQQVHSQLKPSSQVYMDSASQIVPFGLTNLNLTLARLDNCTSGGELDICSICMILKCDANIHLPESWVEEFPRFTAFLFEINGVSTGMVTIPGEALVELGWWIRNDTQALGWDQTLLLGYSNNHMGYFATPNEYNWGGYESQLTFWGENTAKMVRDGCKGVATQVKLP